MPAKPRTFLASPDGVKQLNAAKVRLNLTTTAIAKQAGVSAGTVRRLWNPEQGKRVNGASVIAIAKVLELRPVEIVLVDACQIGLEEDLSSDQAVITQVQTAQVEPKEMVGFSIFISYRREEPDKTLAQFFAQELKNTGFNVFIDTRMEIGTEWAKKIDEALNSADYFLLLFSEKTLQSEFVEMEITNAINLSRKHSAPIIWPVRICLPEKHYESRYPWGFIYKLQHEFWTSEKDNSRILKSFIHSIQTRGENNAKNKSQDFIKLTQQLILKPHSIPINIFRLDGAALSSESMVYVAREADTEVLKMMQQKRALIHVKGAKQTGKTSLIIRQYKALEELGINLRTVLVDFRALLEPPVLESLNSLWYAIAEQIANTLEIDRWDSLWQKERTYNINLNKFFSSFVFDVCRIPILIGFDGVDHVFNTPIRESFFSSLRAFYDLGAHNSTWKNVRWLLSTSTEPSFFIENLSLSPFNVGRHVSLNFFKPEEVRELVAKYEIDLEVKIIDGIVQYLGGHPHLTHLAINQLAHNIHFTENLFSAETAGYGLFQEHLDRYVRHFQKEEILFKAMQKIIRGDGCSDFRIAAILEGVGLIKRDVSRKFIPACELYAKYFREVLN